MTYFDTLNWYVKPKFLDFVFFWVWLMGVEFYVYMCYEGLKSSEFNQESMVSILSLDEY